MAAASPVPFCSTCSTNAMFDHAGCQLLHLLGDLLGPVADDEGGAVGVEQREGMDDVQHHRPTADQVQRLGAIGAHPRSLTGREDDR